MKDILAFLTNADAWIRNDRWLSNHFISLKLCVRDGQKGLFAEWSGIRMEFSSGEKKKLWEKIEPVLRTAYSLN